MVFFVVYVFRSTVIFYEDYFPCAVWYWLHVNINLAKNFSQEGLLNSYNSNHAGQTWNKVGWTDCLLYAFS